jgi:hypothetical protein
MLCLSNIDKIHKYKIYKRHWSIKKEPGHHLQRCLLGLSGSQVRQQRTLMTTCFIDFISKNDLNQIKLLLKENYSEHSLRMGSFY